MTHRIVRIAASALMLAALPLTTAAAGLTPGMYEYTTTMNMPGMGSMPAQTIQRCVTNKDLAGGSKGYGAPTKGDTDCQMKDFVQSGAQFSYKMSCTKPQKMDSTVKGTATATSMTMEMTMMMDGGHSMTQTTTAKRLGDCK